MSFIRKKQDLMAEPIKRYQEMEGRPENLQDIMLQAWIASPILTNIVTPAMLINAGMRGHREFLGVSYVTNAIGFPMPMFDYRIPMSQAERFGSRVGGRVGGLGMQALGHVTPIVGWLPITKHGNLGIGKLPLPPWVKKAGVKHGAKFGAKVGGRLIPGLGWGLLAYDVYDVAFNQRLWGFDL